MRYHSIFRRFGLLSLLAMVGIMLFCGCRHDEPGYGEAFQYCLCNTTDRDVRCQPIITTFGALADHYQDNFFPADLSTLETLPANSTIELTALGTSMQRLKAGKNVILVFFFYPETLDKYSRQEIIDNMIYDGVVLLTYDYLLMNNFTGFFPEIPQDN